MLNFHFPSHSYFPIRSLLRRAFYRAARKRRSSTSASAKRKETEERDPWKTGRGRQRDGRSKGRRGLAQMKFNKISSPLVALGRSIAYTLSRRERPGPLAVTMATQHPAPRDVTAPSICTPLYDYRHHHHHDHHYHRRHYSHHHSPQPLLPPTSSFSSRHRLPLTADV